MHCLKNVSYSLNLVLDPRHNVASRSTDYSTSPFQCSFVDSYWKEFSVVDMSLQFKHSQTAEAVDDYGIWVKWTRLRKAA